MLEHIRSRVAAVGVLGVIALASLLISAGSAGAETTDPSTITLSINAYLGITVDNISSWGQGLDLMAVPLANTNGADPQFPTVADPSYVDRGSQWPGDSNWLYASGAIGRVPVNVMSNAPCTVQITEDEPNFLNLHPRLSDGAGHVLLGHSTIAWELAPGVPVWHANARSWYPGYPASDGTTWLYVGVERKGLADHYGTYTAQVSLDAYTQ